MREAIVALTLLSILSACKGDEIKVAAKSSPAPSGASRAPLRWGATPLDYTLGGHSLSKPISLCELTAKLRGGAGIYRVATITSYMEEVHDKVMPMTYVELELVSPWSDNPPKRPTARMHGGIQVDGKSIGGNSASLHLDETIGLVLAAPQPGNLDFYGIHPLGVFQATETGRYTNGMLFASGVDLDTIGSAVKAAYGRSASDCVAVDVRPESPESDEAAGQRGPDQEFIGTQKLADEPEGQ